MIPIAKEVRIFLLVIATLILIFQVKFGITYFWPFWLVFLALLIIFRDFKRQIPAIPLALVSPIDGKVVAVSESYDPYLKRVSKLIKIRQAIFGEFNVHSPIEGKVKNIWVSSKTEPTYPQLAIWSQTDEKDDVILASDLRSKFRHASCSTSAGEKLGQGQRCGLMAFACEIQLYLPVSAHIDIKIGQSVRAGSDKLAEFVHET